MKKNLLESLSAKEKIRLFIAKDLWTNHSLNDKLLTIHFHDGPMGIRKPLYNEKGIYIKTQESIAYPSIEILASSWNLKLAREYGESLANDCIELGVDILLGPGVNIKRLPLNGRNFEYFSEDPLLTGLLAKEYIEGVQSFHVGTSLKHFCCNNSETLRNFKSMEVDSRTLKEFYLLPFEIALDAKPWTLMTSYNKVNGIKMCQNKELFTYLRSLLKFNGLLISDWNAVFNSVASINAGLDMEFPYNRDHLALLNEKISQIDQKKLKEATKHFLNLCLKVGKGRLNHQSVLPQIKRKAIALKVAEEGIILLKNENHLLPLSFSNKIVGFGRAFSQYSCGGGSSKVIPTNQTLLHSAIRKLGANIDIFKETEYLDINFNNYDIALISVGQDSSLVSEEFNRKTARLTNDEENLIKNVAKKIKNVIVVIEGGGCIEMSEWIKDVSAIIYAGFPGQEGNNALANIIFGNINPSGRLAETFPIKVTDFLSSKSYDDDNCSRYDEKLLVGYRQFVTRHEPVLFPFGYGLSYSNFEYRDLNVKQRDGYVQINFKIKNISEIDGKDVVQIYVKENNPTVERPAYELKGFAKVFVKKKQEKSQTIKIPLKFLGYFDIDKNKRITNSGMYEFMLGKSSIDIKLKKTIYIDAVYNNKNSIK